MANNIALGVVIGGAVSASFGKALGDAGAKIDGLKQKAEKARGFHSLIGDTIRLREEMAKTANKSGDAFSKLLKSHDANIAKLKSQGVAVGQLEKDYIRLGRVVKGLELSAAGRAKIGQGVEQAQSGMRVGAAVTAAAAVPTMVSANYQAIIRDIAIKGGIARTGKETAMSESIRRDAADTGIGRNELAEAVNTLVAGGMSVEEATAQAKSVARFAVSQNADSTDTAKLVLALRQAGITDPKAMENALGKVAVAGDLGSFEAKDMAKWYASLMPQMTAFGMAGENASMALANMLQTQMKAAGSTDEAANNLKNLLTKLTADDTVKKFKDKGIDFEKSMQVNIANGHDPITAFLGIVEKSIAKTDPKKAKEMAALQAQIAKTQDPAAAQKMLDGYLRMAGLSDFISDQQAKQAALAALQNQKLHQENLKLIQSTDGQAKVEKDLGDRRAASLQKWKEVGQAMDEALARIGDAIQPATDAVANGLSWLVRCPNWRKIRRRWRRALSVLVLRLPRSRLAPLPGKSAVVCWILHAAGCCPVGRINCSAAKAVAWPARPLKRWPAAACKRCLSLTGQEEGGVGLTWVPDLTSAAAVGGRNAQMADVVVLASWAAWPARLPVCWARPAAWQQHWAAVTCCMTH